MPHVSRKMFWFCTAYVEVSTTLIFVTVCFVWDFGQTTDRMCGSLQLLGRPKVFCCLEAFLGRCPIVMYNIMCSWKTEGVNTLSSVCAFCIIGVVK